MYIKSPLKLSTRTEGCVFFFGGGRRIISSPDFVFDFDFDHCLTVIDGVVHCEQKSIETGALIGEYVGEVLSEDDWQKRQVRRFYFYFYF